MTTYAELNEVWQLARELIHLRELRDLQAGDITKLTITAETAQGTKTLEFVPTDSGWLALLSRLNTNMVDKIAAIKTRLAALSITDLPS